MATREDIYTAIKNADAAGDSDSVKKLAAYLQTMDAPEQKPEPAKPQSTMERVKGAVMDAPIPSLGGLSPRRALDMGVGMLRGGKDVIDTGAHGLAAGFDKLAGTNQADKIRAEDAAGRAEFDAKYGNNQDAKAGRLGGQGLITLPVGGVLGQGARLAGAAPKVVNALSTNGFSLGAPAATTLAGRAGDLALRSGAGALTGGATVGLVDPDHAGTGAMIGGALPGGMKVAGALGGAAADGAQGTAKWLMKSALKGTAKMHDRGDVEVAVQTLLERGINPTNAGVEKLSGLIHDINDKIATAVKESGAKIDPQKVINALGSTEQRFGNDVAPTANLNAIQSVKDDFLGTIGAGDIPVQLAQRVKQGTYRNLQDEYGKMGSATIEAKKGLARGLKDEIAAAVPEVAPLNAEESRLLRTLKVAERRAMMDANKDPVPLGALISLATGHPIGALGALANSTAWTKAMAARGLNAASAKAPQLNALAGPAAYRALPRAGQQQP